MSKKKPEKVWAFGGSTYARYADKKPAVAKMNEYGEWLSKAGYNVRVLGWDPIYGSYADEDRAKVAIFAAGFLACQKMYADMLKEVDDAD